MIVSAFIIVSVFALATLLYVQEKYLEPFAQKIYDKMLPIDPTLLQIIIFRCLYILISLSLSLAWFVMMLTVQHQTIIFILITPAVYGMYLIKSCILSMKNSKDS